ncbi:hypothetical protein EVJ58_g589 [Rhodofomes roseus]|uniref:STE-domain-containing protein n=1 Tax=Rhodofomes roseus TaxID=34475 RepID=A0A4Y9Z2U2_9APHY|nr:hypothetical protein EVJ58_g589 [Rhodofomes roseus]
MRYETIKPARDRYEPAPYHHPPSHSRLPSVSSHPRAFDASVVSYAPEQDQHRTRHLGSREAHEVTPDTERYYHDDEDVDADAEDDYDFDDSGDTDMAVDAGRTLRERTAAAMIHDPALESALSRPLTFHERELLEHLNRLKFFLATAPARWTHTSSSSPVPGGSNTPDDPMSHPALNRFLLPNMEYVSCVLWDGLYHITGTDIVRALVFRFEAFGRPVRNMKKFEEGVFSDLRNLKPGVDACLEEPKSPFLELLFKYQCIRTQKKQKVFYWYDPSTTAPSSAPLTLRRFSVPHDRLFLDALERDLKRERQGLETTTVVTGEPAQSFRYTYDTKRSLYEQFSDAQGRIAGEGELEAAVRAHELELEGGAGIPHVCFHCVQPGPWRHERLAERWA